MTLPLTPDTLRAAYDYLDSTPPFNRWNLPDSHEVRFLVVRDPKKRAWYGRDRNGKKHTIALSSRSIGRSASLIEAIAHEMIHVYEEEVAICGRGEHSASFHKLAAEVCRYHGFDPKLF